MTCKECIHEKVCDALIKSGCPYLDKEIPAEAFCLEFRNTADAVPKSEYDAVVSALDNSTKEFLKLHDDYQEAKSEVEYWKQQYFRSCVSNGCADEKFIEYLRTNAEIHNDPVGEDGVDGLESAITQAKAEVAIEILREIDNALSKFYCYEYGMVRRYIPPLLIELKKKYTGGKS